MVTASRCHPATISRSGGRTIDRAHGSAARRAVKRNASLIAELIALALTMAACAPATSAPAGALPPTATAERKQPAGTKVESEQPAATEAAAPALPTLHPTAALINEPVKVTGSAEITFPLFENYLVEPYVMLEDEAGFVARDFEFVIPPENQVLGPLTHSGEHSWVYVLHLPAVPPGVLVDVDNNGRTDSGVRVFAVAVQANLVADPFLGRDEFRGWSSVWTSARIDSENRDEIIGGVLLVWAPDGQQAFPSDFGADGLLFTSDDPVVALQPGYTIVDLDSAPFAFRKERTPEITLYEGDVSVNNYAEMSYSEAFEALWSKASVEYPFTDLKGVDWQGLYDRFAPRVAAAQAAADRQAWYLAMRDFAMSIPDGHVGLGGDDAGLFQRETGGGAGLGLTELSDGRVLVSFVTPDGAAEAADIQLGAEIIAVNAQPVKEALATVTAWNGPFSAPHVRRLEQYRYLTRGQVGTNLQLSWRNPGGGAQQASLILRPERASLIASSLFADFDRDAPPVEYEILEDSELGYVRIWSLADDLNMTIRLFKRAVALFGERETAGIILDLRQNLGGSPMGTGLAAYFTTEEMEVMRGYYYSERLERFDTHGPPDTIEPDDELHYSGRTAVLISPACASACENVAWVFSQLPQVTVLGHYPSNGIMGEVGRGQYELPGDLSFQIPTGMDHDMQGNIIVEGIGVLPDVLAAVTEETVFGEGDALLEQAVALLLRPAAAGVQPSGPPTVMSPAETRAAVQQQIPVLEQFAPEEYDNPGRGGEVYTYTVSLGDSKEVLWLHSWCAAGEALAGSNLEAMELYFNVNRQPISASQFLELQGEGNGQYCHYRLVGLSDWPRGEHLLRTEVTFVQEIDDGFQLYPAGTHVFEYRVYVDE